MSARGEVQVCQAPASSLHSNVAPASEEKPKLAAADAVGPLGPESIAVSGAALSSGEQLVVPESVNVRPAWGRNFHS